MGWGETQSAQWKSQFCKEPPSATINRKCPPIESKKYPPVIKIVFMARQIVLSLVLAVAFAAPGPDGNVAMLAICDEKDPAQQWVLRADWVRKKSFFLLARA